MRIADQLATPRFRLKIKSCSDGNTLLAFALPPRPCNSGVRSKSSSSMLRYLKPAPITNDNAKLICSGLGVAFSNLAEHRPDGPFARGRRAVACLGRFTNLDPTTAHYLDAYDRDANKIGTPHPIDMEEAIAWLATAVVQAGSEVRDPFLKSLLKSDQISFDRLRQFFSFATPQRPIPIEPAQLDVEKRREEDRGDLSYEVWVVIKDLIDVSISEQRQLYLPAVGFEFGERFPKVKPVHEKLGFPTLTDLILSFGDFAIIGEHPRWLVQYRNAQQTPFEGNLRYEVWAGIRDLIDKSISRQRPLYLPTVGSELARKFPGTIPAHHNLGFATLTDLVLSFNDFTVAGEHPRWRVQYRGEREDTVGGDLRARVGLLIRDLIDRSNSEGRPLHLPVVGLDLARTFPEARPVHNNLGFSTLTDLIQSFDEFEVTGGHPRWIVHYREAQQTTSPRDLRYEVQTLIGELLDRSVSDPRPLYLPAVGYALAERFPESKPIHHTLGFETLTGLILSFDDFAVIGEHPRWVVQYRDGTEKPPGTPQ